MNSIYKPTLRNQNSRLFLKVKMLDSLTDSYACLENSSEYKETLFQTQRKQNLTNGLTNIKDKTFEFIMKVEHKRSSFQNEQFFSSFGADLLNFTRNEILHDHSIFNIWKNLFTGFDLKDSLSLRLTLKMLMSVCLNCLKTSLKDSAKLQIMSLEGESFGSCTKQKVND